MATTLEQLERGMKYIKAYDDSGGTSGGSNSDSLSTGTITFFAGEDIPDGWLLCNGAEINRDDYANLFSIINIIYGEGDGETTFNLPDFRDAFAEGAGSYAVGEEINVGAPEITGYIGCMRQTTNFNPIVRNGLGAIAISTYSTTNYIAGRSTTIPTDRITFTASDYDSIYNSSETVQPAALAVYYIIKA